MKKAINYFKDHTFPIIIIIGLLLLLASNYVNNLQIEPNNPFYKMEMFQFRNKFNQEVSKKESIILKYKELKKINAFSSETITRLKGIIDKNTQAAASINTVTRVVEFGKVTDTIYKIVTDTFVYDRITTLKNDWINLKVNSNKDTAKIDLSIVNKYDVNISSKRTGAFKMGAKTYFMEVVNFNPYSTTTEMNSYTIPSKRKIAISPGFHLGYGISKTGFSPVVSVGLNFGYKLTLLH